MVLLALGVVLTLATAAHGATAYMAIASMDAASKLDTPNPLALFSDMTATGIKVNNQVDPRNRGAYSDALTQLVLDGTGVCIGLVFIAAGLFLRLNE